MALRRGLRETVKTRERRNQARSSENPRLTPIRFSDLGSPLRHRHPPPPSLSVPSLPSFFLNGRIVFWTASQTLPFLSTRQSDPPLLKYLWPTRPSVDRPCPTVRKTTSRRQSSSPPSSLNLTSTQERLRLTPALAHSSYVHAAVVPLPPRTLDRPLLPPLPTPPPL